MTKFNERSLHSFPLAFFYSALQAFDGRVGGVSTQLQRFIAMRTELHRLFLLFDEAYKRSLKSQSTKTIADLDKIRDHLAYVIEKVANLWATKLDDDALNIHGRRIAQVFKDFDFRTDEALVAENAKIRNIEQIFAGTQLTADLAAMGLTELNRLMAETTTQIEQLMSERNEEQSAIVVGEVKQTREALDAQYRAMITYMNAVQEIQPEESISQAAQYYNSDLQKIERQIAQSHKGGSVSPKPQPTPDPSPSPSPTPDPTPDPDPQPDPEPDPQPDPDPTPSGETYRLVIYMYGSGTMNVTGASGQAINSNDQVAVGATINISVVPVAGKVPTATVNGSTSVALTNSGGTYTGSFQMPAKSTVLEINSDPSDSDDN